MNAEIDGAMRLADLLDGFRPEERISAEERDFLLLRDHFRALQPDDGARRRLSEHLPALKPGQENMKPRTWVLQMVALVILAAAVLVGLPQLELLASELEAAPAQSTQGTGTPEGTPEATVLASETIPLALVPDACQGEGLLPYPEGAQWGMTGQEGLSGGLLGGGELEDGDFTFGLWLACDPVFQRSQGSGDDYSEIDGLGLLIQWSYSGAAQEGALTTFEGIEPWVRESGSSEPVNAGTSSYALTGLQLPTGVIPYWQAGDANLRYVLKTQLPDGSLAGAVLTFTLKREADGFRPADIRVEPLSETESSSPTAVEASEAPFPLLSVGQVYPDLREIEALLTQRQKDIAAGAVWIHQVIRNYSANGSFFEPEIQNYRSESWLQLDYQGNVIASISRDVADEGSILQETVMQDGVVYNRTTGESARTVPYTFKADWGLLNTLVETARRGETVVRSEETVDGRAALVFRFEDNYYPPVDFGDNARVSRVVVREAVDAETGAFLFSEMIKTFEDGAMVLEWRQTVVTEEMVDLPPDESLALFTQAQEAYTPPDPAGTPAEAGSDFSGSELRLMSIPGDDFSLPSFWYGDLYAGETFVGRVDFGATPGGWCARSADGEVLAFRRETTVNNRTASASLNWFRLSDVTEVYVTAATLQVKSLLSWSPVAEQLAFSACLTGETGCGLYLLDVETNSVRMLAEMDLSLWEPLWKPDGTQVAVIGADSQRVYVVDVASGQVVSNDPFDAALWMPAAYSPVMDWGVSFAKEWDGGNCFAK